MYFFFIHLVTAVFCLSFRKFSGVLGAVSGAKSFPWAHWSELYFFLTYKVSKDIFFWSFLPQEIVRERQKYCDVNDLVEEKNDRARVLLPHLS